ncbi:MAG: DinB family protein [Actinomycetota bacterium]
MTAEWTAPDVERTQPKRHLPERESLEQWLDYHRDTLLWKCSGLTATQLKERAVPPSELSLLGLVRHMTEVERWWFRIHGANEDMGMPYSNLENRQAEWDVEDADAEADLETFKREIQDANAAVAGKSLDGVVPTHGSDPREDPDIRWLYVHMIEEYARHNGHADLLREQIDGATGD